jgi:hypothetical protein
VRVGLADEYEMQAGVEAVLAAEFGAGNYVREWRLNATDRPDFQVCGSVALEVKHNRATASATWRQLARYAADDRVSALVLYTGRAMSLPSEV